MSATSEITMPLSHEGPALISLRHDIHAKHPVFGESWRKLSDHECLQRGDQSACVSMLLSLRGGRWLDVGQEFPQCVGKTIREVCEDGQVLDGYERVFRRRV